MAFLNTITPEEMQVGRVLSLVTMVVLMTVGRIPPMRPYARRIWQFTAAVYLLGVAAFAIYLVTAR